MLFFYSSIKLSYLLQMSHLNMGFPYDFDDFKNVASAWICKHWDHAFLLNTADVEMTDALGSVTASKIFLFQREDPTAEAMARKLFEKLSETSLLANIISAVRIWEYDTQYAEFRVEDK